MNQLKPLRFVELALKPCVNVYGTAPCTAEVGVTGDRKCFNSPRTCQDPANYLRGDEQILRFSEPSADLPIEFDSIPCVTGIGRRPQKVDPGESVGVRESVTISFENFKHNDALLDPYFSERDYNTYSRGTFWGKFFARWGNLQGIEVRTVDGFVGQALDDMERRYYVLDSQSGPDSSGKSSVTIKDAIKFLDGDKAQAPAPSLGTLDAGISTSGMALTLSPSGIGSTYPASGTASIGDEIVTFTRSSDAVTLTARELYGSKLDDHDAGESFQIALIYDSETPAFILNDLITNYTDTPADYIDYAAWSDEVDQNIGRLYGGMVMQPTPIKTLTNELISEVGLIFFTDLVNKKISLKAMRAFVPTVSFNDDLYIAGTITSRPAVEKRVSDAWIYYGKKNPLEKQDQKKNYTAIYAQPSENPIVALEAAPDAIREVVCRWISVFNQPAAAAIAQSLLARYEVAPREIAFQVTPDIPLTEGQAINVSSRIFEDDTGAEADEFQCQILQITRDKDKTSVLAEEVKFTQIPVGNDRYIYVNETTYNMNLRSVHDAIYTEAVDGDNVILVIGAGVIIGSVSTSSFALDVGAWETGVTVQIGGTGRIEGAGGAGGTSAVSWGVGGDGGDALYLRWPIEIIGTIEIFSGGGGGGLSSFLGSPVPGGGGAGELPGNGVGVPATPDAGGGSVIGHVPLGGDPGEAGHPGSAAAGGDYGIAVDGISYITITGSADIRGYQIN